MEFTSVKSVRTSETVLEQLKQAIVSREFPPGSKLPSERELTAAFQVSRVVVREAIRALEMSGFVTIRQGPLGGAYVRELGFERLIESYADLFMVGRLSAADLVQVRLYIQPEVARLAALNSDQATRERLVEALEYEQVPTTDHGEWVKRNQATDYVLVEMCGNQLYRAIMEPLLELFKDLVLVLKPRRTVIHDFREHQAIVEAVLSGDGEAAAEAMRAHLAHLGDHLINLERDYRLAKGLAVDGWAD